MQVQSQIRILCTWIDRFSNRLKTHRFEQINPLRQRRSGAAFFIVIVKKTFRGSNVFSTTVHSLMPHFRISEHYYGKRHNSIFE
jgi:hypothetical protein